MMTNNLVNRSACRARIEKVSKLLLIGNKTHIALPVTKTRFRLTKAPNGGETGLLPDKRRENGNSVAIKRR
jgi:hypothetical protein